MLPAECEGQYYGSVPTDVGSDDFLNDVLVSNTNHYLEIMEPEDPTQGLIHYRNDDIDRLTFFWLQENPPFSKLQGKPLKL